MNCWKTLGFLWLISVGSAFAAEEEILLLFTGDRVDRLATKGTETEDLISHYYERLAAPVQERLAALRNQLHNRIDDYEVAFAAADTAEINEIVSDLSWYWAEIQLIHYQEYTEAAIDDLQSAYAALFKLVAGFN